jgi:tetratricopeptide (TPR) repeat protein
MIKNKDYRRLLKIIVFIFLVNIILCNHLVYSDENNYKRGLSVERKSYLYNKKVKEDFAIVIGINDYIYWPPLEYAISDAKLIKSVFSNYGYNTICLLNNAATKENIIKTIKSLNGKRFHRLLIFFAGHGHTYKINNTEKGYIIPIDGKRTDYDSHSISLESLKNISKKLNVTHVLFVFDSCYSGLALSRSGGIDPLLQGYLQEVDRTRSIQVLTAGRKGDQALEKHGHGIFTNLFVKAVKGEADSDQNDILTASEICQWIRPLVYEQSSRMQLPMYGHLLGEGEFLIINKKDEIEFLKKQIEETWIVHAKNIFKFIEKEPKSRKLKLSKKDPLFERILELIEYGSTTLDVKSFILNTINYGIIPPGLKEIYNNKINSKASKRENDIGIKLYWEYKKRKDQAYLQQAIDAYLKSLRYNIFNSQAYSNLSLAYFRQNKYRYAIWCGLKSIEHTNNISTIAASLYNIALCYNAEGYNKKALVFYLSALCLREKETKVYEITKSRINGIFKKYNQ